MGPAYHKGVPCPWGSLKIPLKVVVTVSEVDRPMNCLMVGRKYPMIGRRPGFFWGVKTCFQGLLLLVFRGCKSIIYVIEVV